MEVGPDGVVEAAALVVELEDDMLIGGILGDDAREVLADKGVDGTEGLLLVLAGRARLITCCKL